MSAWILSQALAQYRSPAAACRLDLAAPGGGLTHWQLASGGELSAATELQVLGIEVGGAPQESFVRGQDLVAVYPAVGPEEKRIEVYWRAMASAGQPRFEMRVSVQTSRWHDDPGVATASAVPAGNSLIYTADRSEWQEAAVGSAPLVKTAAQGAGCVVVRPHDADWSYVELVHPTDFQRHQLTIAPHAHGWRWTRRLFGDDLEKGVILRGRLRGVIIARCDDLQTALRELQDFAAAPLPLTA